MQRQLCFHPGLASDVGQSEVFASLTIPFFFVIIPVFNIPDFVLKSHKFSHHHHHHHS